MPPTTKPADGPLTPELRHELELAQGRAKLVRKAARVAAFNGWTTGAIAALSAPFALSSVVGCVVTIALAVVAYNEFRGRKRLLQFDPSATTLLGLNQVGFFVLIAAYCGWMLLAGGGSLAADLKSSPEVEAALGSLEDFDGLYQQLVVAVYGSVIALSAVVQGLNAWYYFKRRKHVLAYLRDTPAWVLEIDQVTSAV